MLYWNRPHNNPDCGLGRGKVWCIQPCLPRGPPCLRRQDPSSVSKAIFTNAWKLLLLSLRLSCEGMKHRQIPSLGTRQSQHLIHTVLAVSQTTKGLYQSCFFSPPPCPLCTDLIHQAEITCRQQHVGSYKCLPPCFLLSSPF